MFFPSVKPFDGVFLAIICTSSVAIVGREHNLLEGWLKNPLQNYSRLVVAALLLCFSSISAVLILML